MKKNIFQKKNANLIILILCIAVICMVSLWQGFERQADWSMEKYGTTSDDSIPINDETEVKVTFKITRDDFQGIFVRITSQTYNFEEEKLIFTLFDNETGKQISVYEMELASEVFDSNTFVPLEYSDSKNKEVTVIINGMDIKKIPYLSVSENFNLKSTLLIDGIKQKNVLVFSGGYVTYHNINYKVLLDGGLLIILCILAYIGRGIFSDHMNTEDTLAHQNSLFYKKIIDKMWNFIVRHKKIVCVCVCTVCYLGIVVFIYQCYIDEKLEKKDLVDVVTEEKNIDAIVIDGGTDELSQTFKGIHSGLSVLYYSIDIKEYDSDSKIHVVVYDQENDNIYHDSYVSVKKLAEHNTKEWKILLQKEFTSSYKRKIKVVIEPVDFENTIIYFAAGLARSTVESKVDSGTTNITPVLTVAYNDNDFLVELYKVYVIIIYIFFLLVYTLFVIKHVSVEYASLPVVLFLGVIYMFIIPVYTVPDEYAHIDTAYSVSNRILGIDSPERVGYEYKRSVDVETDQAAEMRAKVSSYRRIYTSLFTKTDDNSLTMCYNKNSLANASSLFYLPAAIGMTIARLLHWGTFPMLIMGRFCNLLAFAIFVFLAIRKVPNGKSLFLLVATLPIVLQEAASYSYDCTLNGIAFVFVAYSLYFMKKESVITGFDLIILLFTLMQLACVKGGVYLPLCFLVLLIPYERNWHTRKRWRFYFVSGIFILLAFFKKNIVGLIERFQTAQGAGINGFTGKELYTFGYLLHHPLKFVSLYVNTFFVQSSNYLQGVLGGKLGSLNIEIPWIYLILFLAVLCMMSLNSINATEFHGKWSKFFILLVFAGSVFLVSFSMLVAHTTTDYNYIEGVQGRYFVPIVILLLILLSSKRNGKVNWNVTKCMLLFYLNHIFILLNIVMLVLS